MRRDSLGGKRGDGNRRSCRIRRPDPRKLHVGRPDPGLTGYGGLARFGGFVHELAREYDGRAGIEPLIADLKGAWGIGKVPSADFQANHAALLVELLTHNLLKRYVLALAPAIAWWRAPWLRRHGRSPWLRLAPRPHLLN